MALDVSKIKEPKIDTSMLTTRRTPLTKPRSEVVTPYQLPPITLSDNGDQPNRASESDKQLKEKSVKPDEAIIKTRSLELTLDMLEKIIASLGSNRAYYYLLLKMVSDDENIVKISLQTSARIFKVKTIKAAQTILSDLENKKMLVMIKEYDAKARTPAEYKLSL